MKKILNVICIILLVPLFFGGVFFLLVGIGTLFTETDQSETAMGITLSVVGALLIYIAVFFHTKRKKRFADDSSVATTRPYISGSFIAVSGLNIPSGVKCKISFFQNYISFKSLGQEFILPHHRIYNVSTSTTKELQTQYVSSVGGAVAGAAVLGPLGAILGGSPKQRTIRKNTKFLIFSYAPTEPNDNTKYIIFEVPSSSTNKANTFASVYKKRNRQSREQIL